MLNLIATKFMSPRSPLSLLERPRLLEQLGLGLSAKLILVSAPAGSGKSTLLASWLRHLDRPTAWLSLDAGDDDLERFLLYLASALQRVEPSLGAGLPELLQTRALIAVEPIIIRLINDLVAWGRDLVLVLDDYHLLTDERLHNAVEFLLDHLPPQLCLVIATRSDPPLALARLRARGQLLEVRAEDLRFSVRETDAFLNERLGLGLSEKAVARLGERTEGWIAGLQLAALSLEGRNDKEGFVRRFAGSHRYLVEYLLDEVLERQSPDVRRFLQRTAILGRFTAPLCAEVVGEQVIGEQVIGEEVGTEQVGDVQRLLKKLGKANLFLIPLDDERCWWRYHHLFAEFLRHRLAEAEGENVPELHRRASAWLEREGWLDEAVRHAFLAGDPELAARLVEDAAPDLATYWNNARLITYVQRLPPNLLPRYPRLCIYYGWALTNTGQLDALREMLSRIERSQFHDRQPHAVAAYLVTMRAYERLRLLDFDDAIRLCQQALELLGPAQGPNPSREEQWSLIAATNLMGYICLYSDPRRAADLYPVGLALCRQFGIFAGAANSSARLARAKHQLGRLHEAAEVLREGLVILEQRGDGAKRGRVVNVGEVHLGMGRLLYEWNRLDEAESLVRQASQLNELSAFPPVLALELETSLRLHLAHGEVEAARAALGRLDRLSAEVHQDDLLSKRLLEGIAMRGRLTLAAHIPASAPLLAGLLDEVAGWVRARGLDPEDAFAYPHEGGYAVLARLLLAQGKAEAALPLLGRLVRAAREGERNDDLLRYLLLHVLALHASGRVDAALPVLEQALDLAEPERYCRSFVDLGRPMHTLLERLARTHPKPYLRALLAAFPARTETPAPKISPLGDANTLSERERTVLRLLAAGNSNKDIGKLLELSPNTVRWYVSNLLAKLGVKSRLGAVSRARELGLL